VARLQMRMMGGRGAHLLTPSRAASTSQAEVIREGAARHEILHPQVASLSMGSFLHRLRASGSLSLGEDQRVVEVCGGSAFMV